VALTPPIDTLFLDAGGVLVFPNWERVSATLARHGIDVSALALRDAEPLVKFSIDESHKVASSTDAQRGGLYMDGVLDRAGAPRSTHRRAALDELYAYHAAHNLWESVPPDVEPALAALQALGLKLAVVSNANGVVCRSLERGGLAGYFTAVCDSRIEGVEKPHPRFFQIVLERCNSRPEHTLHVGDLYHVDVVGARRAGIRAMLLDPHDLYAHLDVERVRSLEELVQRLN
jgi:HAD superfamily hydrolase (TIGR01509 family)